MPTNSTFIGYHLSGDAQWVLGVCQCVTQMLPGFPSIVVALPSDLGGHHCLNATPNLILIDGNPSQSSSLPVKVEDAVCQARLGVSFGGFSPGVEEGQTALD